MPEISVGSQIFDLVFHPSHSTIYSALLSGKVKAYSYDQEGRNEQVFSLNLSQKSVRGLTINNDGSKLYAGGKGKGLFTIDTTTAKVVETRAKAHEAPISRVKSVTSWLLSTGDDDGVIKLWDPRQKESIRKYTHHFDYISDFLWLDDKKHLLATSGDGTLSVIDVRSKKPEPFAQSEDQEDELLSMVTIKGATKIVVGTQLGILSVFSRKSGWGDCVDRIPGHPQSVDALCALPEFLSNVDTSSTILTGSSDGFMRAVHVFPTELQGVVADHGDCPVERIAVGEGMSQLSLEGDEPAEEEKRRGSVHKGGRKGRGKDKAAAGQEADDDSDEEEERPSGHCWAGSVGHDEVLKLTNLEAFFSQAQENGDVDDKADADADDGASGIDEVDEEPTGSVLEKSVNLRPLYQEGSDGDDSDPESEVLQPRKRKRKEKDPLAVKKKKGKNEVQVEGAFFDEL